MWMTHFCSLAVDSNWVTGMWIWLLECCVRIGVSCSGYGINAILKLNPICVKQLWQRKYCCDAVVSEQVTNHAETQDGCFPETLLCSMLWSLDDQMINFSKQNKGTPLHLEKKRKVAAKPEWLKEICVHCSQLGLLEMAIKSRFLFLFFLAPSHGWHQGWIWLFALHSLGMWEQSDTACCGD